MFDRGSWDRTQHRYGKPQRRSTVRQVLPLTVATIVVLATLTGLLARARERTATVRISPAATPTIAVRSPAQTIASGAPPRATPPSRTAGTRGLRGRASSRGPEPVSPVRRPRVRAVRRLRAPGRKRAQGHARGTPIPRPNSGSLPEPRAPTPAPSDPTVPAPGQVPVAPQAPQLAVAADALPPVPRPAGPSIPPCYPGELNC